MNFQRIIISTLLMHQSLMLSSESKNEALDSLEEFVMVDHELKSIVKKTENNQAMFIEVSVDEHGNILEKEIPAQGKQTKTLRFDKSATIVIEYEPKKLGSHKVDKAEEKKRKEQEKSRAERSIQDIDKHIAVEPWTIVRKERDFDLVPKYYTERIPQ